jgi:hypothetical protein
MANIIYQNTNILRPKAPFTKLIQTKYGDAGPDFIKTLYFGQVTSSFGGILKRWNGSQWTKAKLQVYDGISAFISKTLKVYKDGSWQTVDKL